MESFAALLGTLAAGGPHDWSLPAVAARLGRAGYDLDTSSTGRIAVRNPPHDVKIDVVRDPDITDAKAPGAVYGLGLQPAGEDLAGTVAVAEPALGAPPTLGGPGPWVRWVTGATWWTLARAVSTGTVRLWAEPAARAAEDERRDVEFGGLRSLPHLWRLDDERRLPKGTAFPQAPSAASGDALGAHLEAVCVALAEVDHALPGRLPDLTVTVHPRKGGKEVQLALTRGAFEVTTGAGPARFAAGEAGARAAADAVHMAVATWQVRKPAKDLRFTVTTADGRRLSLPGLGIVPA